MFLRSQEDRYDYFLLTVVVLLVFIGLVMVYSASHHIAMQEHQNDGAYYFKKHFFRVALGFLAMLIGALVPYRFWLRLSKVILLISFVLLVAVLFVGITIGHARRWLPIGGFQFQPVDFARLGLIIYLSEALVRKQDYLDDWKTGVLPQLLVVALMALLVFKQPDLGSTVILLLVAGILFVTAGVRWKHLALVPLAGLLFAPFLRAYQIARLRTFVDSVAHGAPVSYQVKQSMISLGHGGLFGVGLDNGVQKLRFLPEPYTDFIFSIIGEEFGFLGAMVVLTLFLLLVIEGFRIARRCQDDGGMLLATGLTASIALYAFVNAAMVANLLPTKGLPMPFISYGGSYTISTLAAVGILLNISQHRDVNPLQRSGLRFEVEK